MRLKIEIPRNPLAGYMQNFCSKVSLAQKSLVVCCIFVPPINKSLNYFWNIINGNFTLFYNHISYSFLNLLELMNYWILKFESRNTLSVVEYI